MVVFAKETRFITESDFELVFRILGEATKEKSAIPEKAKEYYDRTAQYSHHFGMTQKEVQLAMDKYWFQCLARFEAEWTRKWLGEVKQK